jgi:hypothetical protein
VLTKKILRKLVDDPTGFLNQEDTYAPQLHGVKSDINTFKLSALDDA